MNAMLRRSALRGVGLVGLACIAAKMTAGTTEPDAELINACDELMMMQAELDELFGRRVTIADEHRTDDELHALSEREKEIEDRLSDLPPPSTLAGAKAMSCVAVARWHLNNGDELIGEDFDEWLHLTIIEFLANPDT